MLGDARIVLNMAMAGIATDLSVLWVAYATHNTLKSVPNLLR